MPQRSSTLLVEVEVVGWCGYEKISFLLRSGLFGGVAVRGRDRCCHLRNRLLELCGELGQEYGMTLLKVGRAKRGR